MNIRSHILSKGTLLAVLILWGETVGMEAQGQNPISGIIGSWSFSFSGALKGNGTMTISPEGTMSVYVSFGRYDKLFSTPIVMNISSGGDLEGDVKLWRIPVGRVKGSVSAVGKLFGRVTTPLFDVGTVAGVIGGGSGSGSYQSVVGGGTWEARKQ